MRIAIAGLFHETHSFCVEHNETMHSVRVTRGDESAAFRS